MIMAMEGRVSVMNEGYDGRKKKDGNEDVVRGHLKKNKRLELINIFINFKL